MPRQIGEVLDESHVVALSPDSLAGGRFIAGVGEYLEKLADTQVCVLHGDRVTDLNSFCEELGRALPGRALEPRLDGPSGVLETLRRRHADADPASLKRRYYLWSDADILLRRDKVLFGRLVDAIAGVAAEAEYASEDVLLLHRAVFAGGAALAAYADDERGQFRAWLREGAEVPFWQVVSGIEAPRFCFFRVPD